MLYVTCCSTVLSASADPEGGTGGPDPPPPPPPPPGKSQVIWVSIRNKQLDPPGKSWTPPPPPGKCWTPLEPWKMLRFLWNWPFDFCKISWGLKKKKKKTKKKKKENKKKKRQLFFVRLTWTTLAKIPGSAHDQWRSWSAGFFRSQQIWTYTVGKWGCIQAQ